MSFKGERGAVSAKWNQQLQKLSTCVPNWRSVGLAAFCYNLPLFFAAFAFREGQLRTGGWQTFTSTGRVGTGRDVPFCLSDGHKYLPWLIQWASVSSWSLTLFVHKFSEYESMQGRTWHLNCHSIRFLPFPFSALFLAINLIYLDFRFDSLSLGIHILCLLS